MDWFLCKHIGKELEDKKIKLIPYTYRESLYRSLSKENDEYTWMCKKMWNNGVESTTNYIPHE